MGVIRVKHWSEVGAFTAEAVDRYGLTRATVKSHGTVEQLRGRQVDAFLDRMEEDRFRRAGRYGSNRR